MGANDSDTVPDGDEFAQDKHIKKTLLIDTITKECASSSHNILQKINEAIGAGGKLEATVLSGGYTNYSYKVYVDNDDPELQVFAKLSFEYALWNPDKSAHYDLKRTENEYEIMKTISSKSPGSVVEPLALLDLKHEDQNMKLLVTEWSKADEQFCNQFIDGSVDPRIAQKLADTLASLHTIQDFDPDFNIQIKRQLKNVVNDVIKKAMLKATCENPKDRTEMYCTSLSEDTITNIVNVSLSNYDKSDCLMHGDCHVFNTLVEAKPSVEKLKEFGPNGTTVLCDWELSLAGPIGQDVGFALSFPIGSMIAHALSGHSDAVDSIKQYTNALIDAYLARMMDGGKTTAELADILCNIIGWCGWFQYGVFYVQNVMVDFFPVETEGNKKQVHDAVGMLGLKLIRLSFDTEYIATWISSKMMRNFFSSFLEEEVTRAQYVFATWTSERLSRKSSMLRAANHRLSDASIYHLAAENVKRLSLAGSSEIIKRLSMAKDIETSELMQ